MAQGGPGWRLWGLRRKGQLTAKAAVDSGQGSGSTFLFCLSRHIGGGHTFLAPPSHHAQRATEIYLSRFSGGTCESRAS